jgi:hypothetical protein
MLRFRLRTLIGLQLAVAAVLISWQTPFTVTFPRGDGSFRTTVVKRGWDGGLYRCGSQALFYSSGRKAMENFAYGGHYKAHCVNLLKHDPTARFWDEKGREISGAEYSSQSP